MASMDHADSQGGVAAGELRSFVDRLERLDEEIAALNDDKRDMYAEIRARGYDVKAVKEILKLRKQDPDEREEHEAIVELYLNALGMADTRPRVPEPAPKPKASRAPARKADDVTAEATLSVGDKSATMPLKTAALVMDAMETETGRRVLAAAIDVVTSKPVDAGADELAWSEA